MTLVVVIVATVKWKRKYWERHGVSYIPEELIFGENALFRQKKPIGVILKDFHDEIQSRGCKYGGAFIMITPLLVVVDLELIKQILLKDFSYFMDHGFYYNAEDDPLSGNLFNLEGQRWKNLRNKLSPTFTSGKIKLMFQILVDSGARLHEPMQFAAENKQPIDIKDVFTRFTTDVIGSCAFGIECNSFKTKDNEFAYYSNRMFQPTPMELFRGIFTTSFPRFSKLLRLKLTPSDVAEFFWKKVEDTVSYRETNNIVRNDFLQLLIDIKNNQTGEDTLTLGEIAAQGFIFFLGKHIFV